jgi:glycosyltransferase involved in cell wall biosynthesis
MNLTLTLEQRFKQTPDGAVWTPDSFAYPFWQRYLEVFESLRVVARVEPAAKRAPAWLPASGPGVDFIPLPYYVGPRQYLLHARRAAAIVQRAFRARDALICRIPSQIATLGIPALHGKPYGLEVVGDPDDVFAPGAVRHPLRLFFRRWFARQQRRQCARASAIAYVTEHRLQQRYPPQPGAFTTFYSSVILPEEAFAPAPHVPSEHGLTLVTVGSLAQLYKGTDTLLQAASLCLQRGLDLRLVIIGDGQHRPELERLAAALGLQPRVAFLGQLPAGDAVRQQLDRADLFVLPSRTEGLPRALIEAMARGLPCIGSTAGGIPELLPHEDMIPPGDAAALARKIEEVAHSPARMSRMAARSLNTARQYHETALRQRRGAFYTYVKEITQAWIAQ